jgi:hypothetical protein
MRDLDSRRRGFGTRAILLVWRRARRPFAADRRLSKSASPDAQSQAGNRRRLLRSRRNKRRSPNSLRRVAPRDGPSGSIGAVSYSGCMPPIPRTGFTELTPLSLSALKPAFLLRRSHRWSAAIKSTPGLAGGARRRSSFSKGMVHASSMSSIASDYRPLKTFECCIPAARQSGRQPRPEHPGKKTPR